MKKISKRKSNVKITNKGIANIKTTFNNTIISITNLLGQVITWSSCGSVGFKNTKQSTPYAVKKAAKTCAEQAIKQGVNEVEIRLKGAGNNREGAVRGLTEAGLQINAIKDRTGEPHNGCRPPKKRNL